MWLQAPQTGGLGQGAPRAGGEARTVLEEAGAIDHPGLGLFVLLGLPAAALAGRVVLPFVLPELGDGGLHPRYVVFVGQVPPQGAAAVVGALLIDPRATAAEDAGPGRREPCQVAAETLVGVGWVGELDSRARDIERGLWHSPRLCGSRAALITVDSPYATWRDRRGIQYRPPSGRRRTHRCPSPPGVLAQDRAAARGACRPGRLGLPIGGQRAGGVHARVAYHVRRARS